MAELEHIQLGDYALHEEIGRGGMAVVYRATHPDYGAVAFKVLPPYFIHQPEALRRFLQEARSVGALQHPHIVQLYEAGDLPDPRRRDDRVYFIAMEYMSGGTLLDDLQAAEPLPTPRLLDIGIQIGYALEYAHNKGFVHRDLKPSNILFRGDGKAVLADFGIARAADQSRMTHTSGLAGTIAYIAPEVAQGRPASPRSDIYALGLILYEGLTRTNPFNHDDQAMMVVALNKIINVPLPPISQVAPEVPSRVAQAVERAASANPENRYASAGDLVVALQQARVGRTPSQPEMPGRRRGADPPPDGSPQALPAAAPPPPSPLQAALRGATPIHMARLPQAQAALRGATPIHMARNDRAGRATNVRQSLAAISRRLPLIAGAALVVAFGAIAGLLGFLLSVDADAGSGSAISTVTARPLPTTAPTLPASGDVATVTLAPAQLTQVVQATQLLPTNTLPPALATAVAPPTARPAPKPTARPAPKPTPDQDSDQDGVANGADRCPDAPGPAGNGGCPPAPPTTLPQLPSEPPAAATPQPPSDRDGDGVPDERDACADAPAPGTSAGCPTPVDSDGDGIPDDQDQCHTERGPAERNGCPAPIDNDGDGVPDNQDQCADEQGPADRNGCPPPPADDDGDGVPNAEDACRGVAGPPSNKGCPLPEPTKPPEPTNIPPPPPPPAPYPRPEPFR